MSYERCDCCTDVIPTTPCVACNGTGKDEIGARCIICDGRGITEDEEDEGEELETYG